MSSHPITVIKQEDFHKYPFLTRLLELHQIPKEIYFQGKLPLITFDEYGRATPRILTVIGSRKHTNYGRHALQSLMKSLEGYDILILSGLAYGIDSLAHTHAMSNNLITLAIPGSGLDDTVLYPNKHKQLRDEIIAHEGLIFSELPQMAKAALWTFPQRNRIMAALSDALLIIEAEEKSGTLVTARLALELGRDIGAVPGEIFSPNAIGSNMLIREGAYPISSPSDLLSLLHVREKSKETFQQKSIRPLTENEKILITLLKEPCDKDSLFSRSKLSFQDFIVAFSSLEIDAIISDSLGEVRCLV